MTDIHVAMDLGCADVVTGAIWSYEGGKATNAKGFTFQALTVKQVAEQLMAMGNVKTCVLSEDTKTKAWGSSKSLFDTLKEIVPQWTIGTVSSPVLGKLVSA